nr:cation:proton antiporter [Massilia sp. MS-15]
MREILLFLVLSGILIPILQRLRINQVVGFLAVGTLVGPFGLALLADDVPWLAFLALPRDQGTAALAEIGVLFLMFMIGLELSAARLWALRRWVFGAGTVQVLASALLLGGGLLLASGLDTRSALIVGLVLSLSSTAVVMQLLAQQRATGSPLGQAAFAILMLQDLAVVPILLLIGALGGKGGGDDVALLAVLTLGKAALAIGLIYLVGGRVVHKLFRVFADHRQPDVFMALILLCTFGIAGLAASAGLSMALGALLTGVVLAETEFKHEVELVIEPFKGLLMGLFFMSVGMSIDTRQMLEAPLLLAGLVAGLVLLKALVVAAVMRVGGHPWSRALEGGLLLGQGGEFVFVAIGYAMSVQVLEPALGARVMLVVGLSLFLTPVLARLGRAIGQRHERTRDQQQAPDDGALASARGRIIIAGFGRVGQQLAKLLGEQNIPFIAFECDAKLVSRLHAEGKPVYFGNAARPELLHHVHADEAPAIVLTMDHPASAMRAVRSIRRDFPHVRLFVRSRDEKDARALRLAGASVVVPETLEASLQLSAFVLEAMGLDERTVDGIVDHERELVNAKLLAPGHTP